MCPQELCDILVAVVVDLSVLFFVIRGVLAMGLSLTVKPIIGRTWDMSGLVKVA